MTRLTDMATADACLDSDTLAAYVDGALSDELVHRVDRHIDRCASCREDLSALVVAGDSAPSVVASSEGEPAGDIEPGERIGRYVALGHLGSGGMGVVLRAYDPDLEREVAIKLLRPDLGDAAGPTARARLRREAQAMARMAHPNVVRVHDVGAHGDQTFVAMELVDGCTLREWVADRPWREVLDACVRAGRGLAAAHDAGLVHRDFKPANVLCSDDRGVLVTDFGLARVERRDDAGGDPGDVDGELTHTRALLGTPAYMAPELYEHASASAKSDQFAFCVTAHEALFGARPFAGRGVEELRDAIVSGDPAPPPAASPVPAQVARALRRGMARDPDQRFSSMSALLDALRVEPARRRTAVVGLAMVAAVLAALIAGLYAGRSADEPCRVGADQLAGAWDDERRADVAAALAATGRVTAPAVAERLGAVLDDYAARWIAARAESCQATNIRGEQSAAVLDARTGCLDRRRRELAELTELLATTTDPALVDTAVEAAYALRQPESCDADSVGERFPLPDDPDERARIAAAFADLDRVAARRAAGEHADAIAVAERVLAVARDIDHPPLLAEALREIGQARILQDDHAGASEALFAAIDAAAAAHDDRAIAELWINIVILAGPRAMELDVAMAYADAARVALARMDPAPALRARFAYAVGATLLDKGEIDRARAHLEEALSYRDAEVAAPLPTTVGGILGALCDVHRQLTHVDQARAYCVEAVDTLTRALGRDSPMTAVAINSLGAIELSVPDYEAAEAHFSETVEICDRTVGASSITRAIAVGNLGLIALERGDLDAAQTQLEAARDAFERYHPEHPRQAPVLSNLASVAYRRGEVERGIAINLDLIELAKRAYGPNHALVHQTKYNVAIAYMSLGRADEARALLEEAIAEAIAATGKNNLVVVRAYDALADYAEETGELDAAVDYTRKSLESSEALFGPNHPETALGLRRLGHLLRRTGDAAGGIEPLERAIAIFGSNTGDPNDLALAEFALARAVRTSGGDLQRAIALVEQAVERFDARGSPTAQAQVDVMVRWLEAYKK